MNFPKAWMTALALATSACALGYANDPQFQNWLTQAEGRCASLYGALPSGDQEQRAQFEKLSYQAYYKDLSREVYADRLGILYPEHRLTTNCLATAFPRP